MERGAEGEVVEDETEVEVEHDVNEFLVLDAKLITLVLHRLESLVAHLSSCTVPLQFPS